MWSSHMIIPLPSRQLGKFLPSAQERLCNTIPLKAEIEAPRSMNTAPISLEKTELNCVPARSADRARSLARVSEKREYFKCRPETIGDFAPKLFILLD